jgi:hypothetical protein
MDEDEVEYRFFELLIETSEVFSRSRVMFFTFHGISMAFKKNLLSLLDESEDGKMYGKLNHVYTNFYIKICSFFMYMD